MSASHHTGPPPPPTGRLARRTLLGAAGAIPLAAVLAPGLTSTAAGASAIEYPTCPAWLEGTPGGCGLQPPPYPHGDPTAIAAQAQQLSDRLATYIDDWFAGRVPATLPADLVPSGRPAGIGTFVLQRPDQVDPAKQWVIRPSAPFSIFDSPSYFPDPHVTYLILPSLYAPFGTTAVIRGKFPHARYFNVQVSPPFDPKTIYYGAQRGLGVGEVGIVDADIQPDPGSVNPYQVNADRRATNRDYTVRIKLGKGDPVALNGNANKPPYFRGTNDRVGGAIEYTGPWGGTPGYPIPAGGGAGHLTTGNIWIRYYAPDHGTAPLAGVPLPKILYRLPDGREFFIQADFSAFDREVSERGPITWTAPAQPEERYGPDFGWYKEYGVLRTVMQALAPSLKPFETEAQRRAWVRQYDAGVNGHGEHLGPHYDYDHAATEVVDIDYLTRRMGCQAGMVVVLTGRLPTTPRTRNGEATMTAAQARYWSLTSYSQDLSLTKSGQLLPGMPITSLMDDEITVDSEGRYVILLSRTTDRPSNATRANGVTWADWGPVGTVGMTVRWMSVGPEWTFCRAPDQNHLGWRADGSSANYDAKLVGRNRRTDFLGDYQPVMHYLSRGAFEALGNRRINPSAVPKWQDLWGLFPGAGVPTGPAEC
ncbi:hypothetical protein AB0H28_13270 [Micromonospora sp. NPDC050980]|uniref:hypothetical protein n=1 Tax=Micromonospora sp. NPDC050980 TaxID=3155161 RepID=UPI00340D5181